MAVASVPDGCKMKRKAKATKLGASEETVLPSPVSFEAPLLLTPAKFPSTIGRHIPSPPPSPTYRLRRMLRDSSISTTPSSPPTEVTERVPDDLSPSRPMCRITFDSDSPSLPCMNQPQACPFSLMGNRGHDKTPGHKPRSKAALSQDASEEAECPPKTKSPRNRAISSRGVVYRPFDDIIHAKDIDPRIWLPNPPEFDPTRVIVRPSTKAGSSSATPFETAANSPKAGSDVNHTQSPTVRMDRGRPSRRITPSLSLPVLPSRGVEANVTFSTTPSSSPSLRNVGGTGERGTKLYEQARSDNVLREEMLGRYHTNSPRWAESTSHIQVVQRGDGSGSSAFKVHCPPGCLHESCSPVSEVAEVTRPRYVDAAVSPVFFVTTRLARDSRQGSSGEGPVEDLDDVRVSFGFARRSQYVPHQGNLLAETDVRSPIAKGTQVPSNTSM